jgi:hypothetical protein
VIANRRRLARALAAALLLACTPGCVWLQNEFFVFDVPPPTVEVPGGADAGH